MRGIGLPRLVGVALAVTVVLVGARARANDMDPVLARMWTYDESTDQIVPRDDLMDGLALDLAYAIAPNALAPAETLGWSGFFLGLEGTVTVLNQDARHLICGVESAGGEGDGGDGRCDSWGDNVDSVMFTPGVHVRKGLPYSFELGFQVLYIANTELVAIGGEVRWSPLEGFRNGVLGYFPDISFRFSGSYLMGSSELTLGVLGGGAALSRPFAVSGQFTLTPYAGYDFFIVGSDHEQVVNSYVLEHGAEDFHAEYGDEAEEWVSFHDGESRNFGQGLRTLKFHRAYLGLRVIWENLAVTPQFGIVIPWEDGDADESGVRFQFSVSVGTDF